LVCGSNPTCACRNALTSSSVGKFSNDNGFEVAAACALAGLPVFAVVLLEVCAATVAESISNSKNILNEWSMSFLIFGLNVGLGGNRKTPAVAKSLRRNLDSRRCLLAFVLIAFNHAGNASHHFDFETAIARYLFD